MIREPKPSLLSHKMKIEMRGEELHSTCGIADTSFEKRSKESIARDVKAVRRDRRAAYDGEVLQRLEGQPEGCVCGADAVRVWKKQVGTTAAAQAYVYKREHLLGYQAGEQVWGR